MRRGAKQADGTTATCPCLQLLLAQFGVQGDLDRIAATVMEQLASGAPLDIASIMANAQALSRGG